MGYPSALTAKTWGFYDVLFDGKPFRFQRPYGTYVMENVLFKIAFPAEFHAQTAAEAALQLHRAAPPRAARPTTSAGSRSARTQPRSASSTSSLLANPADRDHCIQYMVAVLLHGRLTAADYEDSAAADPRIDALRAKTVRRGSAVHAGLPRPGQALDRECTDDRVRGRVEACRGGGRIPARPPAAPGRRHPAPSRSSGPTLPAASRPSSNKRFSTCRWTRQSSKRCRSMSTSTCM